MDSSPQNTFFYDRSHCNVKSGVIPLKGIVHPKILSVFTHPHVVPNP